MTQINYITICTHVFLNPIDERPQIGVNNIFEWELEYVLANLHCDIEFQMKTHDLPRSLLVQAMCF